MRSTDRSVTWLGIMLAASSGGCASSRFAARWGNLTWGAEGGGRGEFRQPVAVDVAPSGEVYVADSGVHGGGPAQLNRPPDVAMHDDRVYVADTNNDRVQVFAPDGMFQFQWGRTGGEPGSFRSPSGIDVGPDGSVYVVEFLNHRLQVFDRDGKLLRHWGREGTADGEFYYPTKVTVGNDARAYVADGYNHRVQVFASDGMHRATWGAPQQKSGAGHFNVSGGVAIGRRGHVWVADFFNDRVLVVSAQGEFVDALTGREFGLPLLHRPTDVALGPDGTVYVVDHGHNRIQRWRRAPGDARGWMPPLELGLGVR